MNRVVEVKGVDWLGESRVTQYYTGNPAMLARWLLHNGWKYAMLTSGGREIGGIVLHAETGHRVCWGEK